MWLIALSDHRPRMYEPSLILANAWWFHFSPFSTLKYSTYILYTVHALLSSNIWVSVTGIYSPPLCSVEPLSLSLRPVQTRPNHILSQNYYYVLPYSIYYFLFTIIAYTTASADAVWECVLCCLYELAHSGSLLQSSAVGQSRPAHSLPPPLLSSPSVFFLSLLFASLPTLNNTGKFCGHLLLFLVFIFTFSGYWRYVCVLWWFGGSLRPSWSVLLVFPLPSWCLNSSSLSRATVLEIYTSWLILMLCLFSAWSFRSHIPFCRCFTIRISPPSTPLEYNEPDTSPSHEILNSILFFRHCIL